jgi:ankyrin repeat protein
MDLIHAGFPLEEPDIVDWSSLTAFSPLHTAVMYGSPDIVQFLLNKGLLLEGKSISSEASWWIKVFGRSTPLTCAVRTGRLEMVRFLLERGANLHARSTLWDVSIDMS